MAEIDDKTIEDTNSTENKEIKNSEEDSTANDDTVDKDKMEVSEEKEDESAESETAADSNDKDVKINGHDKKEGSDDDEDDDDDDESDEKAERGWAYIDDDEKLVGSLEKEPLLDAGTKRESKKTQWLSLSISKESESPKSSKTEIPEGKGTKLGDIPRVERELNKTNHDDLKPLHRLLFGKQGKAWEIKRNIRKFNGFAFEEDTPEYKKKKEFAEKFTIPGLKFVCEVLDLERSGTKSELEKRLMEHLMEPRSSGKPVPGKRKKQSADKKNRKEKRKKVESVKIRLVSKPKKTKKTEKDEKTEDDEEKTEKEVSDVSDVSDSSASDNESEEAKPPAKKQKISTPKVKAPKKTPVKKQEKPKSSPKKSVKSPTKKSTSVTEDSDSDDEPLVKKKKPPTNEELKKSIKKILDGADLEECTMKTVLSQVYGKFPDFDLMDRKDFMKLTIREMIS